MTVESVAAPRAVDLPAALKESLLSAVVALALAVPIIGLRTFDSGGGALGVQPRFDLVAIGVVAVFVGRLAIALTRPLRQRGTTRMSVFAPLRRAIRAYAIYIAIVCLIFAAILPFLPFSNRYVIDTATQLLIYVMLGWGLNVVVGLAGLLDLGYVAFYAVGAYSYALAAIHLDISFWLALPFAGVLAALFGIVLGFPVLRLRGDYLAIVTLGFGEMVRIILINWYSVTKGPDGLSGISRPSFFGYPFMRRPPEGTIAFHDLLGIPYEGQHRVIFLYFLILVLALITNFFTLRLRKLPLGRAWEALREDETASRALGINPTNTKLSAFAIGAMFAGFAGSFFATRQGFISPESFTFIESAIILAIVVLGGMGSQIGVVIAAFVLVVLPEFIREFAEFRMLVFGGAMVLIMIWRPRGLIANREPTIRLSAHQSTGSPP